MEPTPDGDLEPLRTVVDPVSAAARSFIALFDERVPNMQTLELATRVHTIVTDLADVGPSEEVVILADPPKLAIAEAFAYSARAVGASTLVLVTEQREAHSNELPPTAAAAMREADLVVSVNTYAITHTDARREASAAGARYLALRGVTEEMIMDGMLDTDYETVIRLTKAVGDIHTAATAARVTSDLGTDISVDLTDRVALPNATGYPNENFVGLPMAKSGISPVEGSGNGDIVFDYSFDNLGILDEPMRLTVEDGRVTSIEGGADADRLRIMVEEADEGARNLAEAPSLGTNPDMELTGVQTTDKKKLGTINFAIGDNVSLGGTVESDLHLDGIVLNGTLEFDGETFGGETLIEDGEFDVERAFELAEEVADRV